MITIGTRLPETLGTDQNGQEISLQEMAGRKFVLYFYPKDNTPGCTAEACSLRDNHSQLQELGYEVIGVSADSAASHQRFIEKFNLPFRLIADTDRQLIEAVGVWGEKSMYGKTVMGIVRTTLLIDEKGCVEQVFSGREINTKEHAKQIMDSLSQG